MSGLKGLLWFTLTCVHSIFRKTGTGSDRRLFELPSQFPGPLSNPSKGKEGESFLIQGNDREPPWGFEQPMVHGRYPQISLRVSFGQRAYASEMWWHILFAIIRKYRRTNHKPNTVCAYSNTFHELLTNSPRSGVLIPSNESPVLENIAII